MKKFAIQLIILLVFIFGALFLYFKDSSLLNQIFLSQQKQLEVKKVVIGQTQINVEIANTITTRSLGLGQRDKLASDSGMLFVFDKSDNFQFWMKGMRFPLDMIFIMDSSVVDLVKNAPIPSSGTADKDLPRFSSNTPFNKLIEVNSGFVDMHDIKVGDMVQGI